MNNIYNRLETEGEYHNYFSHPLYFVDFLEGIMLGTRLVTSKQAQVCTDGMREIFISAFEMDGDWRQVVYQMLDIMYFQFDMIHGCLIDVIMPVTLYTQNKFKTENPEFLSQNLLRNFGPMVLDGYKVINFFLEGETDEGGEGY